MLELNLALQATLIPRPLVALDATQSSAASSTTPTEGTPSAPIDFDQLLQGLSEADPSTKAASPELLAVASAVGSANLLEGIAKPKGFGETPKEQKPPGAQSTSETEPLTALQAFLGAGSLHAMKAVKGA